MDNEFILFDRIEKIKQIINDYGENNFYISFSGGKDSCVLSSLIDLALPDNNIPRVFSNTGIELNMVVDFVKNLQNNDDRYIIVQPNRNIKDILEKYGYPFKSKEHSLYLSVFQNNHCITKSVDRYLNPNNSRITFGCPDCLKYQFSDDFNIKISRKCCDKLKKEPLKIWAKENNKLYTIIGVMRSEGGGRSTAKCLAFKHNKLYAFQPLAPLTKDFENWFIDKYNIKLCSLYYEPYNFKRTGCKGCPFDLYLQKDLDTLKFYFPNEAKQCEYIWQPIYKEYRSLGYRLRSDSGQTSIFDFL